MAMPRKNRPSFDVTCVVGTVYLDGESDLNPHEAAMLLIAKHTSNSVDAGTFTFPGPGSNSTTRVTVEFDEPDTL